MAYKIRSVHARPTKIKSIAPFILRLHLPSTLIRQENGDFRKRSSKGEFENAGFFAVAWTENILKMDLFENDAVMIITGFGKEL